MGTDLKTEQGTKVVNLGRFQLIKVVYFVHLPIVYSAYIIDINESFEFVIEMCRLIFQL